MTGLCSYGIEDTSYQLQRIYRRISALAGHSERLSCPFVRFLLFAIEFLPPVALGFRIFRFSR